MNKEIIEEFYKYKFGEINKELLGLDEDGEYCIDNESYHIELDDLLLNLLNDIGFKEIVKMYNNAKKYFWYS